MSSFLFLFLFCICQQDPFKVIFCNVTETSDMTVRTICRHELSHINPFSIKILWQILKNHNSLQFTFGKLVRAWCHSVVKNEKRLALFFLFFSFTQTLFALCEFFSQSPLVHDSPDVELTSICNRTLSAEVMRLLYP